MGAVQKKSNAGRPTRMTDTTVAKLEMAFSVGANVSEACLVAGVSRDCYYAFLRRKPEYNDRFEELRQRPVLAAKKRVMDAIVEEKDTKTARWLLERRCQDEFGVQRNFEVTVEEKPQLTEEEIARQLKELIAISKQRARIAGTKVE